MPYQTNQRTVTLALAALLTNVTLVAAQTTATIPAVRVRVANVCGSGVIAGKNSTTAYVTTNAHVVGTSVGRSVSVDVNTDNGRKTLPGTIVYAAYSDRSLIDFAVVAVPGLTTQNPSPLSTTPPLKPPYTTTGAPQCIWPLVTKPFNNPTLSKNSPLIQGDPNAIGGQSGSAITNSANETIAVLTWSWNGRCAGQQSDWLWRLAQQKTFQAHFTRPDGLIELAENTARSDTSEGIFYETASELKSLPIWSSGNTIPPPPPVCPNVTPDEKRILDLIQGQRVAGPKINWIRLIELILQIIALLQNPAA